MMLWHKVTVPWCAQSWGRSKWVAWKSMFIITFYTSRLKHNCRSGENLRATVCKDDDMSVIILADAMTHDVIRILGNSVVCHLVTAELCWESLKSSCSNKKWHLLCAHRGRVRSSDTYSQNWLPSAQSACIRNDMKLVGFQWCTC